MEVVTSQWEINIRNKALQEGLNIGMEKGMEKLYAAVRAMKHKGFEDSLISELTGLSEEKIQSIVSGNPD